jgi:Protein of unknown function (DUF2726)
MSTLQIGLAAAVVVLLLIAWLALRRGGAASTEREAERLDTVTGWPPTATRVLSTPERMTFVTLARALPDHVVLAQVPLSRFLDVPKRNSYADWLRRIGYQCADFVVCDVTSKVIGVVELQSAQPSERARKRMARIARTLKAAKVPLHVWSENNLPTPDAARLALVAAPTEGTPSRPMPLAPTEPARAAGAAAPPANPFDDTGRDSTHDERIEFLEPPPTWYDDLDSGAAPLGKRE